MPAELTRMCHILMTSLTGHLVDKLTLAFENTKSVNFPQNNVRFILQVDDIRHYVIVYLFTTRFVQLVKLTMCLNIMVSVIDEKFGFFETIWP